MPTSATCRSSFALSAQPANRRPSMRMWPGAALLAGFCLASATPGAAQPSRVEWRLDSLERIGGHAVTIVGEPAIVDTDRGRAIAFDGVNDGLLIAANPLAGLTRFTVE